jgi:hypothetical protein
MLVTDPLPTLDAFREQVRLIANTERKLVSARRRSALAPDDEAARWLVRDIELQLEATRGAQGLRSASNLVSIRGPVLFRV